MNVWKVIFATMVIFGAGVVTGGLVVRHATPPRAAHPVLARSVPLPPSPGVLRVEFLRRMERELDLTSEQRERVDKLIKESQEHTRKLLEPVAPQLREELQRTKERFRVELTPEQRARFDELLKQQQRPHDKARSSTSHERATSNSVLGTPAPAPERPAPQ